MSWIATRVAPTLLPTEITAGNGNGSKAQPGLMQQLAGALSGTKDVPAQHWAVLVCNMFKEEQAGNPGLLEGRITP